MVFFVLTALPCRAAESYFSLFTGSWSPNQTSTVNIKSQPVTESYSVGRSFGGAIGLSYNNGIRLENEVTYRKTSATDVKDDMQIMADMVNFWFGGFGGQRISPYLGGGLGIARVHVSSPGPVNNTGFGVAYQAGGGFEFLLPDDLSLDLCYRYVGVSDPSKHYLSGINVNGSSLTAGWRLKF